MTKLLQTTEHLNNSFAVAFGFWKLELSWRRYTRTETCRWRITTGI